LKKWFSLQSKSQKIKKPLKPNKRTKSAIPLRILKKYHPILRPPNKKRLSIMIRWRTLLCLQKFLVMHSAIIIIWTGKKQNIEVKVWIPMDGQRISIIHQAKSWNSLLNSHITKLSTAIKVSSAPWNKNIRPNFANISKILPSAH